MRVNVNFNAANNSGFVQTTLARSTGDLYIDTTRSAVQRQGLGEAMYRKALDEDKMFGTRSDYLVPDTFSFSIPFLSSPTVPMP